MIPRTFASTEIPSLQLGSQRESRPSPVPSTHEELPVRREGQPSYALAVDCFHFGVRSIIAPLPAEDGDVGGAGDGEGGSIGREGAADGSRRRLLHNSTSGKLRIG